MAQAQEPAEISDLESLLGRLAAICEECEEISIGQMLEAVGQRSFGALLLLLGIIPASPLSGVPGLPTLIAVLVVLVAVQILARRRHVWLPQWILRRAVPRTRFAKAIAFLRPIARVVDRLLRPRLMVLSSAAAAYLIAALCLAIALTMPPLELVPFANTTAGIALSALGLGLIARDGVLILLAVAALGAGAWLAVSALAGG